MTQGVARRSRRARVALGALTVLLVWLAVAPAVGGSRIVLATAGGSPDWLLGIFRGIGTGALAGEHAGTIYYLVLLAAAALWALVVQLAPRISPGQLLWCSLALIGIFMLAPPLLSQDVFSYIAYARLDVVHGLDPYSFRPFDIPQDPVFGFAGSKDASSVYGPFFTILTLPLAHLSVSAAMWVLKGLTALCTAGLLLIVRDLARRIGVDQSRAIALVGLSPATLVHVVGGAHNEALTMLIVFAGIWLALSRADGSRWPAGGFLATLATGVKASAAVPLPFMLAAARRRTATFVAMLGAGLAVILTALGWFGADAAESLNLISSNQSLSSRWSLPHRLTDGLLALFGGLDRELTSDIVRGVLIALLLALIIQLLRRSWKRPETWLANAGWATFGVLLASAWLLPWYPLWLLPFAALARDARLRAATIVLTAYMLVIAIPF